MQRTVYYYLIFIGALLTPAFVTAKVVEQVVVVINGEPYTLTNFKEFAKIKMHREFPKGDLDRIETEDKEVLEQFITEKLLAEEVKLSGIKISEDDVGRYIGQIQQRNKINDEDLVAALKQEGVTLEGYRASIRAEIEKGEIINRQVRKRVNITAEDVERYYRLNPKRYMTEERVRLRHILLALPEGAPSEREQEAMRKALQLRSRALAGEDFTQLARDNSEGAGAAEGGDIGWVKRGSLLKEIEEISFNKLSAGQVSQPLRTSLGFHLIKLEGREASRALPLAEVQAKIKEELYAKALDERFQKWLKGDLRRRHRVDIKLPGVVFRPEEMKEATVDTLMASSAKRNKNERSGLLSYLNPFSYILTETPIEGEDAEGKLSGHNIVSVFGIPLFKSDSGDDILEDVLPSLEETKSPAQQQSEESGGFFSTIWKTLNPFSSNP